MSVFSDRITIQQDSSTDDNPSADYSGAAFADAVPCNIVDVRGLESYRGNQLVSRVEYLVEMWHLDGVTPDMRVYVDEGIHTAKTLNITHVRDAHTDGQPKRTDLYCTELVL